MKSTRRNRFEQVELSNWQTGVDRPIAVVGIDPAALAERCGIRFTRSYDDLDYFDGALIHTQSGKQFALVRYVHAPEAGTDVWGAQDSVDAHADLEEVLKALGLPSNLVTWKFPQPQRGAARMVSA